MKKNVQRQEGIRITKDFDQLLNGIKDEYIIVQELLQNPFLVNGRKINLREEFNTFYETAWETLTHIKVDGEDLEDIKKHDFGGL